MLYVWYWPTMCGAWDKITLEKDFCNYIEQYWGAMETCPSECLTSMCFWLGEEGLSVGQHSIYEDRC